MTGSISHVKAFVKHMVYINVGDQKISLVKTRSAEKGGLKNAA